MIQPTLHEVDREIYDLIQKETRRQNDCIRLIPSENYVSKAVLEASGSILTNKYSEGYPFKRYYEGQVYIDQIEQIAIDRAKKLFKADHANVQPYSGSPANMATYFALIQPGDKIMGMMLSHGGHLTHGFQVSFSSKIYKSVQYTVDPETHLLNFDSILKMAQEEKPKVIICGATAYPREIDFSKFKEIADKVGAYLVTDIAHINGLIVAGEHPSPVPYADIVTSTSHKMIRGPRGGFILCKKQHAEALDKAVFPCLQGGPHNHTTAAMAVCFKEAATPEYKEYAAQVRKNARALADRLKANGFHLITGGTDNHLILLNMIKSHNLPGKVVAKALDKAGIECNFNTVPWDERKPFDPSGVRLGTPAITSRGMKEAEMEKIGDFLKKVALNHDNEEVLSSVKAEVLEMTGNFPAPGIE